VPATQPPLRRLRRVTRAVVVSSARALGARVGAVPYVAGRVRITAAPQVRGRDSLREGVQHLPRGSRTPSATVSNTLRNGVQHPPRRCRTPSAAVSQTRSPGVQHPLRRCRRPGPRESHTRSEREPHPLRRCRRPDDGVLDTGVPGVGPAPRADSPSQKPIRKIFVSLSDAPQAPVGPAVRHQRDPRKTGAWCVAVGGISHGSSR
jgi:hypothetical protein